MSDLLTNQEVVDVIHADHLQANIDCYEGHPERGAIQWDRAWVDRGGTIFGPGPYLHVPIILTEEWGGPDEIQTRVYAPARLQRRLAEEWENMRYGEHLCAKCNPEKKAD